LFSTDFQNQYMSKKQHSTYGNAHKMILILSRSALSTLPQILPLVHLDVTCYWLRE